MMRERLRQARLKAGLTQEDAARLANLERNTVNRYERGRTQPTLPGVCALAKVYGKPLDWFLDECEVEEDNGVWGEVVDGLAFGGKATLEFKGNVVVRGGFPEVVGGFGLSFVGVGMVACVAGEGWSEFDMKVIRMVPFPADSFEARGVDPGNCVVLKVGGDKVVGKVYPGCLALVEVGARAVGVGECFLVKGAGGVEVSLGGEGGRSTGRGEVVLGVVRWVSSWL